MGQRRIEEILLMDRKLGLFAASALRAISNVVVILWVVLMAIALINKADEGLIILGVVAIPVLLLWLLGRYAYRLIDWMTKDYPKELSPRRPKK